MRIRAIKILHWRDLYDAVWSEYGAGSAVFGSGVISHAIERKIERSGHGGRVIYVRIASTIIYVCIGLYHFWDAMHLAGRLFDIRVHM